MYNGKGSPPVESIMRSPAASPDAGSHESFASSSVKEKPQAHSWTAFVREANGSSLSRYIKRVSFDLFPDKRGQVPEQERQLERSEGVDRGKPPL
eukprot:764233-Hanusia_phi.AAC.1